MEKSLETLANAPTWTYPQHGTILYQNLPPDFFGNRALFADSCFPLTFVVPQHFESRPLSSLTFATGTNEEASDASLQRKNTNRSGLPQERPTTREDSFGITVSDATGVGTRWFWTSLKPAQ